MLDFLVMVMLILLSSHTDQTGLKSEPKTRLDKTRPDMTRLDKTRLDKTRPENTRPENTGPAGA